MRFMSPARGLTVFASLLLLSALTAFAQGEGKKFTFTTKSKEAREAAEKLVWMIETFTAGGPDSLALAQKAVAADRTSPSALLTPHHAAAAGRAAARSPARRTAS